jgi:hypothetical protein
MLSTTIYLSGGFNTPINVSRLGIIANMRDVEHVYETANRLPGYPATQDFEHVLTSNFTQLEAHF